MFEAFPRLGEALVWETVTGGYVLDDLSDQQVATFRALNDRDVLYALEVLQELGAARGGDQGTVEPTELALWALGRASQAPAPGDPMLQIRVTWPGLGGLPPAHLLGRTGQVRPVGPGAAAPGRAQGDRG